MCRFIGTSVLIITLILDLYTALTLISDLNYSFRSITLLLDLNRSFQKYSEVAQIGDPGNKNYRRS